MNVNFTILRDDIPKELFGVKFERVFRSGFGFANDRAHLLDLYFQFQPYLKIINHDTQETMFEYRLLFMEKCKIRREDNRFHDYLFSFMLPAIGEFNRQIQLKDSNLTINKFYTPSLTLEQATTMIDAAYDTRIIDVIGGSDNEN